MYWKKAANSRENYSKFLFSYALYDLPLVCVGDDKEVPEWQGERLKRNRNMNIHKCKFETKSKVNKILERAEALSGRSIVFCTG